MDPILRQKIYDKLLTYLNREPSENEIINGQNDANLMHWIAQDDVAAQNDLITAIGIGAGLDVASLKSQISIKSNAIIQ